MPKSRQRRKSKRVKRPAAFSPSADGKETNGLLLGTRAPSPAFERAARTHSPLRDEIWAMVQHDESLIHFGCTYDEALELGNKHGGTVMTDRAANRIHGFNELAAGGN